MSIGAFEKRVCFISTIFEHFCENEALHSVYPFSLHSKQYAKVSGFDLSFRSHPNQTNK